MVDSNEIDDRVGRAQDIHNVLFQGKYKILETIAQGTFGKAYLARNIETSQEVVIKLERSDK